MTTSRLGRWRRFRGIKTCYKGSEHGHIYFSRILFRCSYGYGVLAMDMDMGAS